MPFTSNSPNHFLASLSADDRKLIAPHLKPLHLQHGAIFYKAEGTIERVFVPPRRHCFSDRGGEQRAVCRGRECSAADRRDRRRRRVRWPGRVQHAISQAEGAGTVIDACVVKRLARESEADPHCIRAPGARSGGSSAAGGRVGCACTSWKSD